MPAGIADAPGGIPLERLIFKLGFGEPQHEVVLVALVIVGLYAIAHADLQVFFFKIVEDVVFFQFGRIKVDVAAGKISVAFIQQRLYGADKLVNTARGRLNDFGAFDIELFAVGKEGVGVELRNLHDRFVFALGTLNHLVFAGVTVTRQVADVGDVHHAVHVVTDIAEIFFQYVLHNVGTQIADVGKVIHRRAAGVHRDVLRVAGSEFLTVMRQGIIKQHKIPLFVEMDVK